MSKKIKYLGVCMSVFTKHCRTIGMFLFIFMSLSTSSPHLFAAPSVSQAQIDTFMALPESQQRSMVSQLSDAEKKSLYLSLDTSQQKVLLSKLSVSEQKMVSGAVSSVPKALPIVAQAASTIPPVPTQSSGPTVVEKAAAVISKKADLKDGSQPRVAYPPLKQFGYSLFEGAPTTFAPTTDIPIPNEYIIGPGDEVNVLLFGKENDEFSLTVTREGEINFPRIGPVSVSGLTFKELKDVLYLRISQQTIGTKANITLGTLRSIRVFVLGDVNRPGSYTISALSTLTNALFVSGGITPIGTLRDIELKRQGKVVLSFDLYDLLLNGDTSNDARLLPGDVIFVKPLGKTVGIGGEIRRPAIYELGPKEKTVRQLLSYSGGMLPTAFPKISQIERISENGQRTLVELDLSKKASLSQSIMDGDTVRIFSVLDRMDSIVMLSGHVRRPGGTEWRPGLRVQDVVKTMDELKSGADTDYGLIRREDGPNGHVSVVRVNLQSAINDPFGPDNILLSPRDQLTVFSTNKERAPIIKGLINELRAQARFNEPALVVNIVGNVRFPGAYPYQPDMRISELVRASLDLLPETDMQYALVKREYPLENRIEVFSFGLHEELKLKESGTDLKLLPSDQVTIFNLTQDRQSLIANVVSKLREQAHFGQPESVVTIKGNVKYPGAYPLGENMRVSDLVRASLDVLPATDMRYAILRRESVNRDNVTLIPLSLNQAMNAEALEGDPLLHARDQLIVLSLTDQRNELISEYVAELRLQARHGQPESVVTIKGNVKYPGAYPLGENMRVSNLVLASLNLLPETDMEYALIQRLSNDETVTIIPVSLNDALSHPGSERDIRLLSKDSLIVFNKDSIRRGQVESIISDLNRQAKLGEPALVATISGQVEEEGEYPITQGMRISDLVFAARGLEEAAYSMIAEITRYSIGLLGEFEASHRTINLGSAMAGDLSQNILIEPHDSVSIKQIPGWNVQEVVSITGKVKFPGVYPIVKGETLAQVLIRAGGVSDYGDRAAAIFSRESLRDRENKNKEKMIADLEMDMAQLEKDQALVLSTSPQGGEKKSNELESMQRLIDQVKSSKTIGRLVIDLPGLVASTSKDILLKNGDKLHIPQTVQEVGVFGEVMNPNSLLHSPSTTLEQYIQTAGGLTSSADKNRIYVIKSNGAIVTSNGISKSLFKSNVNAYVIDAGDVIMVPLDLDDVSDLTRWTNISQITYQFAITAASLAALGIF